MAKLFSRLFAASIAAMLSAPATAEVYLLHGLKFSPYEFAQLVIDIQTGAVLGEVRPLRGDTTPIAKVTGTNSGPGILDLTFHLPSNAQNVKFKKSVAQDEIRWEAVDGNDTLSFYRPSKSQLSDYALTLYHSSCGPFYGELEVVFKNSSTLAAVRQFIASDPQLAKLKVSSIAEQLLASMRKDKVPDDVRLRRTALGADLLNKWTLQIENKATLEKRFGQFSEYSRLLKLPVGSELYFTQKARGSGLFEYVNLIRGGCGGSERSFFAIDRGLFFDGAKFSTVKFQTFIETGLTSFAQQDHNGKKWKFRLGQQKLSTLGVPPYSSSYRVKVYVASEISRRKLGEWDSFYVNFDPTELEAIGKNEYAVVVTVERLKASKRSSGSDSPPDDQYFKKELDYENEAEVTTAVSYHFSRRSSTGWCHFETEGAEPRKVKCDNQ